MLQNLMDTYWLYNEATGMYVCKLSMCLEKPKFAKIMLMLQKRNWFVVSFYALSYGCTYLGSTFNNTWEARVALDYRLL